MPRTFNYLRRQSKVQLLFLGLQIKGMMTAMTVDEAVDGEIFKAFVDQLLVPALKPSDTVLMDNLRAHKVQGIEEAIQSTGAHLQYLPPYSPELSPIEHGWSKLKESLRRGVSLFLTAHQLLAFSGTTFSGMETARL